MVQIKYTRTGQPYKIMANGRARFIKKTKSNTKKIRTTKPRGIKTMVRRRKTSKKSYSRKSNSFMGMNSRLIWQGVGAGTGGLVGGVLDQFIPGNLGGNVAQGIAGIGLSYFTKGIPKMIGQGMVISSIGQLVSDNLVPMLGGISSNYNGF